MLFYLEQTMADNQLALHHSPPPTTTQVPLMVSFAQADPAQVAKLGAKGAKLVEDFQHVREDFADLQEGIDVPDGFILSTEVWQLYHQNGDHLSPELRTRIFAELQALENRTGRRFGDRSGKLPLIVAVRGGAPVSLPGAIGTVLNVGLNDDIVKALVAAGEDRRFVMATYVNAIRLYGEVVLEIPYQFFYEIIQKLKLGEEGSYPVEQLDDLIDAYRELLSSACHPRFRPGFETDLEQQLINIIEAVLASWMAPTAFEARRSRQPKVSDDMGTAIIVQSMVFGNRDENNSLSGVFFTRNQRSGVNDPVIEWAPRIQCDKIVSGKIRKHLRTAADLQRAYPDIHERLLLAKERFESRAKRPLDIEFTVESRKLFILQRRPLRMTFNATVRSMWDLVDESKTNIQQASLIINNALEQPEKVLREGFIDYQVLARGEPITDSADTGILAFGTESALDLARQGQDVVLLRRRPYGETDVAVNHPRIRAIIRYDGNTTGHEAVSAVAYSKPYLINVRGADGEPLMINDDDELQLNPKSQLAGFIGKSVFVDGERGIVGYTEVSDFLEDRKIRKKQYVDWEYVHDQFSAVGYESVGYRELLDLHYQWELELEHYQRMEAQLRNGEPKVSRDQLIKAFATYLTYVPRKDWERDLSLKDVTVEDFRLYPEIVYYGSDLGEEVLKVLRTLMLCTTWCTHWVHEIMVQQARARGDTENDVIRDIYLKNRTMSLLKDFEREGFHLMTTMQSCFLIFASNFEYNQDLDQVQVGPGTLNFAEKEVLARDFVAYLESVNPQLHRKVRLIMGEPPLGQGHARIVSIGIEMTHADFDLVCRYLKTFLANYREACPAEPQCTIPVGDFVDLYQLDPFFAPYPDIRVSREASGDGASGDVLLALGRCSYGEFDGVTYGKDSYDLLVKQIEQFQAHLKSEGGNIPARPWHFEVDPYRRHSVIAAVGIRFSMQQLSEVLKALKTFLVKGEG
jgi:phosphoenolpyruvate synthase/pyruvate phosphate dikinase